MLNIIVPTSLKKAYNYFERIMGTYQIELEKAVGTDCKKLLDVGCGSDSPVKHLPKEIYKIGIDAHLPNIRISQNKKIHEEYHLMNLNDISSKFQPKSFDCVLALDVIEHLSKQDGEAFLKNIETISRNTVIVFTPNGFLPQQAYDNNPWQIHKSGWTPKEMKQKGYTVIGINGIKALRCSEAKIRFRPVIIWNIISTLTQSFTKNHPELAFQILCIKKPKTQKASTT